MRILLANDDGVEAPGIEALVKALYKEHEVIVSAPAQQQSGMSHAMTLGRRLYIECYQPYMDGLSILKQIRTAPRTAQLPVIMLTAKSAEIDKVRGLDLGADDYVSKPFGILELLSRIRAVARRTVESGRKSAEDQDGIYEYRNIRMDEGSHTLTVDGQEVTLTRKEFQLLGDLLRNQGRVLTRDQIMEQVWGFDYGGATRTVDIHINTLRKKIGDDGSIIQTVRGVGYKIDREGGR